MNRSILIPSVVIACACLSGSNYLYNGDAVSIIKNNLVDYNDKIIDDDDGHIEYISVTFKNVDIRPSRWSWSEDVKSIFGAEARGMWYVSNINVSFDPKNLALSEYPIFISDGGWRVNLNCQSGACIDISGDVLFPKFGPRKGVTTQEHVRNDDPVKDLTWHFRDKETAKRVASAVNSLLRTHGANQRVQSTEIYATTIETTGDVP